MFQKICFVVRAAEADLFGRLRGPRDQSFMDQAFDRILLNYFPKRSRHRYRVLHGRMYLSLELLATDSQSVRLGIEPLDFSCYKTITG